MRKNQMLQKKILAWYENHGRKDLPWRADSDPYKVLVAEVLLRKTRVEQALPVYQKITKRFPKINDLAEADHEGLRRMIAPIGLPGRAESLKQIAIVIVEDYKGKVPEKQKDLEKLPGIGRYIASSIRCFGYEHHCTLVDGNVSRIYSRVFGIERKKDPSRDRKMWKVAEKMLPSDKVQEYNAALLDLGALICAPQNPKCNRCPLHKTCRFSRKQKT